MNFEQVIEVVKKNFSVLVHTTQNFQLKPQVIKSFAHLFLREYGQLR